MKYHYYASFGLGWATAETRQEAMEKLVKSFASDVRPWLKNSHKAGEPGVYVWSCKVHAPADAHYGIEYYCPVDVECSDAQEHYLTHFTAKEMAFWKAPDKGDPKSWTNKSEYGKKEASYG